MRKWLIFIVYLLMIIIGFIYKEEILHWIQDDGNAPLPLMFIISAVFATIPIVPFSLFSFMMGAKFGMLTGTLIIWFGGLISCAFYFLLARFLLTDFFKAYLNKFKHIEKFQLMIEKNTFLAVFLARIVPVVPPPVVNIYSGISFIAFLPYIAATALGKIPPAFFVAYTGGHILSSWPKFLFGAMIYLTFVLAILFFFKKWFRENYSSPSTGSED
ncbi:TVP38/TMEM64 family protein [Bacillus sp. M6-12]|uniref:TVP38/TMEM64 family protein n=1 Tax=Bacillus sp. M6-12 TaxID=2054166 RepID=UPI000C75F831|nr:VTT domain-containing protein [Bacillus sp. M6-12]PLS18522.1 TVP38/TMEM64 family protein [Bacillus sp. M6-12]